MKVLYIILFFLIGFSLKSQNTRTNVKGSNIQFSIVKELGTSSVKNQQHSSTCWCFSTESMLESELKRLGKTELDLSEMYIVRKTYEEKAIKYIRMQGKMNFAQGGAFHDVMNMIKLYGLMPQNVYPGQDTSEKINHDEIENVLKGYLDAVLKMPGGKVSKYWFDGFKGILDAYFGKVPEKFSYQGKQYTPLEFAKWTEINPDDYIEITSFLHHPLYQSFVLEVPDNWSSNSTYNVSIDEMDQIAEYSIMNGYSVAWGSDVSEFGFSFNNGLCIVPDLDITLLKDKNEKDSIFKNIISEKKITQELRQDAFDRQTTQDDHGMHFTGLAKDQSGKKYYIMKNSWGTGNDCGGYQYCSQAYFMFKTTSIMVHKNAIPKELQKKLMIR